MTTNRFTLLSIGLILCLLLIVSPACAEVIVDESFTEYEDTSGKSVYGEPQSNTRPAKYNTFYFLDIGQANWLDYVMIDTHQVFGTLGGYGNPKQGRWVETGKEIAPGYYDFTYTLGSGDEARTGPGTLILGHEYDAQGQVNGTKFIIYLHNWNTTGLSGTQPVTLPFYYAEVGVRSAGSSRINGNIFHPGADVEYPVLDLRFTYSTANRWYSRLIVSDEDVLGYKIDIYRKLEGLGSRTKMDIYNINDEITFSSDRNGVHETLWLPKKECQKIVLTSSSGKVYNISIPQTGEPIPTPPQPTMRTGTVTMTDHNGTTIRGFEVKAVNYYTGKEYTASTETDVATITLPMDRTTSLRNPQTGQYEDVPVGYYTFFVSKPGYKMTSEDGVRISVLPEEYSPYHFGDIIVTSEDGCLTGKHQFQIRSRADKRILQTGTISAQSATTGEWYNTTVVNGLATLILPYDTSSAIFPYVGNYYVYATSPGYIPSEYATQISVRPDTQSEIRWILLTPIGGIPEAGNVTLRIHAFSDSWQEIPNVEINIDGVEGQGWQIWDTYTASSTGYAEISVPGNSTYDITVYGQGYYGSSQRIEVGDTDPPLTVFILYPTGAPTPTPPTTQPTGWVTPPPTTQPPGGIPGDDGSQGFLSEAIRGISKIFGVGFATGKTIFGMLLALAVGFATAKQLRGGAAEFGFGLLGGTMLGVLIGLLPVWVVVVLLLIVGMYIGYRYVGGSSNG